MAKNPTGQIETSHPILSVLCLLSLSAFFFFFFLINVQVIWHNASKMCLTRELWAHIFSSWGDANFIQAWKRLNVSPERRNCEAQFSFQRMTAKMSTNLLLCWPHTTTNTTLYKASIIWLKTFPSSMKPWPTLRVLYLLGPRARP